MKHLVRNDISRNFELRGKVACAAHADRRLDDATWRNRMVLLVCLIALAASCALFVGVSHSWFTQSTLNSGNKISVVEASGASDSQPASAPMRRTWTRRSRAMRLPDLRPRSMPKAPTAGRLRMASTQVTLRARGVTESGGTPPLMTAGSQELSVSGG